MSTRDLVLAGMAVAVGAVFAALSLETLGVALLLLIPVAVVLKRRATARLPLVTVTFALGYLIGIGFFAWRTSGIVGSDAINWGVAAYFGSLAAVGVVVLVVGLVMHSRRSGGRPIRHATRLERPRS